MTEQFERLSREELTDELVALEERLADSGDESELRNVLQNLRVHQIELEMQNRELREARQALEEARDRYADLYDFAPVGYATLDAQGVVREINLTGARMLGQPRSELLGKPLVTSLEPGQSKAFFRHLRRALDDDAKTTVELALRSVRGATRWAALESVRARDDGKTVCRTAMLDITERRRTEAARRESEGRLALIADNVPVLIAYVDTDRRYVFNNAAYEQWFGHSRDRIHGRHMRDVLGDEAYAKVRPHVDTVLSGDETHFEAQLPYRDAGSRYVAVSYIPHRNEASAVRGFFALIHDLSQRRQAEQALEEERGFVSAVLDTAGALVVVVDRRGCIVRFNRECERVTGYHSDEVAGRHFDMFLVPEERAGVGEVFESLSSGDFPNSYKNYWVAKDGTPRLIAWSNTALTDASGEVTHIIATGIDITEQRRMEEDLERRERQLRLITDTVPVLIAYVDRGLRYRFVNAAYRQWLGLDPEDSIGQPIGDVLGSDTYNTLKPFALRALDGEEVSFENTLDHRSLGRRDVSVTFVPDRDTDGGVKGYYSVVADITERKRGEELEKQRLLDAAHADRLTTMGEMTTEIAHELNQPLTAIATTADVCVEEAGKLAGESGRMLADALGEISSQAHRAAKVVKHVRTFARRREPEFVTVGVKSIVDSTLSLVRVETRSRGVAVETRLHGPPVVQADPVLIEQLLVNLARNAIEAMAAAGTRSPRLSLTSSENEDGLEIRVADNGPGLSVEAREHLFEPFYTTKADGMGLGLSICRSIVEAHGGRIWAGASSEGGAEFVFTLNIPEDIREEPEPA